MYMTDEDIEQMRLEQKGELLQIDLCFVTVFLSACVIYARHRDSHHQLVNCLNCISLSVSVDVQENLMSSYGLWRSC